MADDKETPAQTQKLSFLDQIIGAVTEARIYFETAWNKLSNLEKSNMELGIRHLKAGNFFDAVVRFKIVTWLNKNNAIGYYLLGKSQFYHGKPEKAIAPLQKSLQLNPDIGEAKFLLAACGNDQIITAIPRSFIIEKDDMIALRYDDFIANTSSHLNAALQDELYTIIGENMGFNVLDLGCRGGDSAQILRKSANAVIGVEPSLKLIALAKNRRIDDLLSFNQLATRFPEDYLKECKDKFAVVISTYYLDNFGELKSFFEGVHHVMEAGSLFAFNISKSSSNQDFAFSPKLMIFTHSEQYISKLSPELGFIIVNKSEVKYPSGSVDLLYILEKK